MGVYAHPPPPPYAPRVRPVPGPPLNVFRWVRLAVLLAGIPCLALVVAAIVWFEIGTGKAIVLLDNGTAGRVTVAIDGKRVATLEAGSGYGSHENARLEPGKHRIVATDAGGREIENVELEVPPKVDGRGFRALVSVGQARRYALASVVYVAPGEERAVQEKPRLVLLPLAKPVAELPRDVEDFEMSSLDTPFLETVSVPRGSKSTVTRHVCTLRQGEKEALGCSGFTRK